MNNFEEPHDVFGRNSVCLRAESVSATWMVMAEEGAVDERLELIVQATTELWDDDELKPFTQRYPEGWIEIRHCEVTVGSINLKTTMQPTRATRPLPRERLPWLPVANVRHR